MINESMKDFIDKQEVIRQKKKDLFNKIIDLQIQENPKFSEIEELNKQLEKLRNIENDFPTKFEK